MKRLAVIGSGIAGLSAARFLRQRYELTVYEADTHVGGHSNTVDWQGDSGSVPVDTGFMVFNHATYPNLLRLFTALGIQTRRTDMSFGVRHDGLGREYCGSSLNHLFAQRSNLVRPAFLRMLWNIDRFNREAATALGDPTLEPLTLAEYVARGNYGNDFLRLYLLPMSSAIWSTPPELMLGFPALTLLRFFHNHGFLGMHTQHPWWTVVGGARSYVRVLSAPLIGRIRLACPVQKLERGPRGITVFSPLGSEHYDKVIFACHPPATLAILGASATHEERSVLSAFRYQPNVTTLHSDESVLPRRALARSSWNYLLQPESPQWDCTTGRGLAASTHYLMTRLQGIPGPRACIVSINGTGLISPESVQRRFDYEHPLFDRAAVAAQDRVDGLNHAAQGGTETYFAGAWRRYGFHEDGLLSGIAVAAQLIGSDPWAEL